MRKGKEMGLLGKSQPPPDRSRDITKVLRDATDVGDPTDDVEAGIKRIVHSADQYGKRTPRYEHEDIVMANEYIAMIQHIDDTLAMLRDRLAVTVEEAEGIKAVLAERITSLTRRVDHEKAVINAYRGEFAGLHTRVTEIIDAENNPDDRGGSSNGVRTNGRGERQEEPSDVEVIQEPTPQGRQAGR